MVTDPVSRRSSLPLWRFEPFSFVGLIVPYSPFMIPLETAQLSLTLMVANAAIIGTSIWRRLRRPNPIDRWELCRTPSYSLAPAFSSDTLRTIHLSPLSGTQVSYESKTPFRRSPSPALWRQESSGIHVTEEKVSIIHFPHPAVTRDRV